METTRRELKVLTPEICRGARGLLGWSQEMLAERAGVSRSTIRDYEVHRHELHRGTGLALERAFEEAGIQFLEPDEFGPGMRLRIRSTSSE